MELAISEEHLSRITQHCQTAYPNEACGILLGLVENGTRTVVDVMPTGNAREEADQRNRYLIPPESLLEGELLAEERGLEVIGYFHSHPDHPARPSEFDREHAWPWYSYLIVSVLGGKPVAERSWRLREDQNGFDEETVIRSTCRN
jgi:proteasome lid subunit RPN8/RPN11